MGPRSRNTAAPRQSRPAAEPSDVRPAARRERKHKGGQLLDNFALPQEVRDDMAARGVTFEWKAETVTGQPNNNHMLRMREQGFDPVESSRYPQLVVEGHSGPIRRDGLILMERPVELYEEAKADDRRAAKAAISTKEQQLGLAGNNEFQRHRDDGTPTVSIKRSFESGLPIDG